MSFGRMPEGTSGIPRTPQLKILVTGGCGFIGSHLCESLLARGHEVMALDDLSSSSADNLRAVARDPKLEITIGSVLDEDLAGRLVARSDYVYHLAAAVGVRKILADPSGAMRGNLLGCEAVFRLCRQHLKPALFASSSEVYGRSVSRKSRESDPIEIGPPAHPRWAYAAGKAAGEHLAYCYHAQYGLPVVIARFFNIIGPRQSSDYGMVAPTLVRQARAGVDMTVFGDGSQTRCFLDVRECVEALADLAERQEAFGQVYNIGNPSEISILELAGLIRELCASSSRIVTLPYAECMPGGLEDFPKRLPDISKLASLLGFSPSIPLRETLLGIIEASS